MSLALQAQSFEIHEAKLVLNKDVFHIGKLGFYSIHPFIISGSSRIPPMNDVIKWEFSIPDGKAGEYAKTFFCSYDRCHLGKALWPFTKGIEMFYSFTEKEWHYVFPVSCFEDGSSRFFFPACFQSQRDGHLYRSKEKSSEKGKVLWITKQTLEESDVELGKEIFRIQDILRSMGWTLTSLERFADLTAETAGRVFRERNYPFLEAEEMRNPAAYGSPAEENYLLLPGGEAMDVGLSSLVERMSKELSCSEVMEPFLDLLAQFSELIPEDGPKQVEDCFLNLEKDLQEDQKRELLSFLNNQFESSCRDLGEMAKHLKENFQCRKRHRTYLLTGREKIKPY